jgi:hypothetical protein
MCLLDPQINPKNSNFSKIWRAIIQIRLGFKPWNLTWVLSVPRPFQCVFLHNFWNPLIYQIGVWGLLVWKITKITLAIASPSKPLQYLYSSCYSTNLIQWKWYFLQMELDHFKSIWKFEFSNSCGLWTIKLSLNLQKFFISKVFVFKVQI